MVEALRGVKTPNDIPSARALCGLDCDVNALLVFPNGDVYRIQSGRKRGCIDRIPPGQIAVVGSGGDVALGAMLAGKSAAEACAIACKVDTACREPITTLSLDAEAN